MVAFPATAYLLSWEWAQPSEEPFVDPRALRLLHGAVYVITAMLLLGDDLLATCSNHFAAAAERRSVGIASCGSSAGS